MGLMNSMRNRGGLLVGVIGFAIVAFLVGDVIVSGRSFFNSNNPDVGVISGESISYKEFQARLEKSTENYRTQSGQNTIDEATNGYLIDQTWNQAISELLMNKSIKASGVSVSSEELFDMVQGPNPHPEVRRAFTDPNTGLFDPAQVINFLKTMDQRDPSGETRKQWLTFEKSVKEERLRQKYFSLVKSGMYITNAQAKEDYTEKNRTADIRFVMLDYSSISDSAIKVSESDMNAYYSSNKYRFQQKDNVRSFDYIYVDINPSSEDTAATLKMINEMAEGLRTSVNDSAYVALNTETPYTGEFTKKGQLSPAIDSIMFGAAIGTVYGPYFDGGAFRVAKLIAVKQMPDSVRARHILLPASMGPAAKTTADSLKKVLDEGGNFAALALQYSSDGSKDRAGDLGYFDQHAMVKPFSDACFFGKKGDRVVVSSQFGVHIIEIMDQKNFNKTVQVGVIDRKIEPSQSTRQTLYAKANGLISTVKNTADFEKVALVDGVGKRVAENVKESDRFIAGLESPRELIRWAYKAEKGDISPLFEIGNKYVFANMTQIKNKGTLALEYVKAEVEAGVKKEKKAEMLKEKLNAGGANLEAVAQKTGSAVTPATGLNFAYPVIPGVAREPEVVGTVFGLTKGKVSKAIAGQRGVYMVDVTNFNEPVAITDYTPVKFQLSNAIGQRVESSVMEALKAKANIQDNRVKYY